MANKKPFEAKLRQQDETVIIDLYGDIDGFAEESLNQVYEQTFSVKPLTIMLNFSEVGYINSTGIALIVSLLAEARKNHIELITYGLSDHYKEIFQITRLSDFMLIVPNESVAFENLSVQKE